MIKSWIRGKQQILNEGFGKTFIRQTLQNPYIEQEEEFFLIGQPDWAIILPVTLDKEVITVRQYKAGCNQIINELPAGIKNYPTETWEETATRELLEETGYSGQFRSLGSCWMASGCSFTQFHCFLAENCYKLSEQKLDANERIEIVLFSVQEWLDQIFRGIIQESSSIVTTCRALPYLQRSFVDDYAKEEQ